MPRAVLKYPLLRIVWRSELGDLGSFLNKPSYDQDDPPDHGGDAKKLEHRARYSGSAPRLVIDLTRGIGVHPYHYLLSLIILGRVCGNAAVHGVLLSFVFILEYGSIRCARTVFFTNSAGRPVFRHFYDLGGYGRFAASFIPVGHRHNRSDNEKYDPHNDQHDDA